MFSKDNLSPPWSFRWILSSYLQYFVINIPHSELNLMIVSEVRAQCVKFSYLVVAVPNNWNIYWKCVEYVNILQPGGTVVTCGSSFSLQVKHAPNLRMLDWFLSLNTQTSQTENGKIFTKRFYGIQEWVVIGALVLQTEANSVYAYLPCIKTCENIA